MKSPVLLIVFNRPDLTAATMESIRRARPPRLYVAADGPRHLFPEDQPLSERARELATAVDWPCKVHTLFRSENLGLKYGVSAAISWFFGEEEEGIVLEDDVVPTAEFFEFCERSLEIFRKSPEVGVICGSNPVARLRVFQEEYAFAQYVLVWGWASWRRVWQDYDVEIQAWETIDRVRFFDKIAHANSLFRSLWTGLFDGLRQGKINSWVYQLNFCLMHRGYLAVIPYNNLIDNIGYGLAATHTTGSKPAWLSHRGKGQGAGTPEMFSPNHALNEAIGAEVFGITLINRFRRLVKNLVYRNRS